MIRFLFDNSSFEDWLERRRKPSSGCQRIFVYCQSRGSSTKSSQKHSMQNGLKLNTPYAVLSQRGSTLTRSTAAFIQN